MRGLNERKEEMSKMRNKLTTIQKSQERMKRKIDLLTYVVMFITFSITLKEIESSIGKILGFTAITIALISQSTIAILDIIEKKDEKEETEYKD